MKEIKGWQADDGEIFTTEEQCRKYEARKKFINTYYENGGLSTEPLYETVGADEFLNFVELHWNKLSKIFN